MQTAKRSILGLIEWFVASFAAAAIGAVASVHAKSFYGGLVQPAWAPPAYLFGPVWTVLYTMMAVAAWLVWRADQPPDTRRPLTLFLVQLLLNALWSWLFFFWHLGALALVDILTLWLLIIATMVLFWRIRPAAGVLLLPYLAWVSFAAALNYSVWSLNPGVLG